MLQLSPLRAASSEEVKHPVILCCLTEETQKGEKKEETFRVEGVRWQRQLHTGEQHRHQDGCGLMGLEMGVRGLHKQQQLASAHMSPEVGWAGQGSARPAGPRLHATGVGIKIKV